MIAKPQSDPAKTVDFVAPSAFKDPSQHSVLLHFSSK